MVLSPGLRCMPFLISSTCSLAVLSSSKQHQRFVEQPLLWMFSLSGECLLAWAAMASFLGKITLSSLFQPLFVTDESVKES